MRVDSTAKLFVVVLFCLFVGVPIATAQATVDEPLPSRPLPLFDSDALTPGTPALVLSLQQIDELAQWTREFTEWQQWADEWLNRRQPGRWAFYLERHQKPEPPAWLNDVCEFVSDDIQFADGCALLARWRDEVAVTKTRQATAAAVVQREAPTKTSWWQRLHVDGLWSTTQSNMIAFGIFGTHLTAEVKGRLQVFVVPGILLVSVPVFSGNRELTPATDWGVSYRLFSAGRSIVHFNLVHAWMLSNRANFVNPNMTLGGFSVSFKPRPR